MSYDLYCYRPTSETPNLAEARVLVESFNARETAERQTNSGDVREKIADALVQRNSRFERFQPAAEEHNYIEVSSPEDDAFIVQFIIYNDHVFVTVPYWYKRDETGDAFSQLSGYLRLIREIAGFFVYDPQTETVFDPAQNIPLGHEHYDRVVDQMPAILNQVAKENKKPWWKFW